jgi:hypothetical protein
MATVDHGFARLVRRPVAIRRSHHAAGGGPFYYYDTVFAQNNGGYADAHGWAWLASLEYSADQKFRCPIALAPYRDGLQP